MWWLFCTLSAVLLIEGIWTLKHVVKFRHFFIRELIAAGQFQPPVWPKVALLAPCKGNEEGLRQNIQSWFEQEYPAFKIFFVVESDTDAAVPVIRTFENPDIIVAGISKDCGQKVHNLKHAIQKLPAEYEILAFVDSDCQVAPDWLRNLVRSLLQDSNNAASGYRWFTSAANFSSLLRAAWNSTILTLYRDQGRDNFVWGGSMAISRTVFDDARVAEFWEHSISDDYSLTAALKASNRRVNFVPGAIALTHDSTSLKAFLQWAFRQLLITRIYNPRLWRAALVFHCAWFSWLVSGLFFPIPFLIVFLAIQLVQACKADLRWQCMNARGGTSFGQRAFFWTLGPFVGLCNFVLLSATVFTRTVRWRGVEYVLHTPRNVTVRR